MGPISNNDSYFVSCICKSEGILITEESEALYNNYHQIFYLAFLSYAQVKQKPNFFKRLKYAFRYLITGKYYYDQVIINDKQAELLIRFLKQNIEKYRTLFLTPNTQNNER